MSLYKSAQLMNADDLENFGDEDEVVLYEDKPSEDDVIEMHNPENHEDGMEITFKLPVLPGSDADMPLEVSSDEAVEVESKGKKDKNDFQAGTELEVQDPWKSPPPAQILEWVHNRLQNLPRHSGRETTGIERTIAVMKRINTEISKAIANDYNGEVDIAKLENARKEIFDGIHRLEDAKEKLNESSYTRKKSSSDEEGLIKEAKQDRIGGIIITVPILISRIAKVLINGMVSGGHDIELMMEAQVKEYDLTKREQVELMELLENMGYAQPRRDRGYQMKLDKKMNFTSSDNFDFGANYPA